MSPFVAIFFVVRRQRAACMVTVVITRVSSVTSIKSSDHGPAETEFTGTVNWVQIDLGEDAEDADHLITPEERLRVAMTRQ
jgi:hypothetical protein